MEAQSSFSRDDSSPVSSFRRRASALDSAAVPTESNGMTRTTQLVDIFTTSGILEERAAHLAARHLTEQDAKEISSLVRAMEAAGRGLRTDQLVKLDRRLHFTIYRAAGRPHMLRIIEQLWAESEAYSTLAEVLPDLSPEGMHVLRSIVSACERKDEGALGTMIRYKIHRIAAQLVDGEG